MASFEEQTLAPRGPYQREVTLTLINLITLLTLIILITFMTLTTLITCG
jgi:hypothetical protein